MMEPFYMHPRKEIDSVDGVTAVEESQHPSIVNSVTNDEEDDNHHQQYARRETCQSQWHPPYHPSARMYEQEIVPNQNQDVYYTPSASSIPPPLSRPEVGVLNANSYLHRYESMIQAQEKEQTTTLMHVKPMLELLERIIFLTRNSRGDVPILNDREHKDGGLATENGSILTKELSVADLRRALVMVQSGDVDKLNDATISPFYLDLLRIDTQWMMVLTTICGTDTNDEVNTHDRISWAEILQCYRLSIVGMQTLECLATPNALRGRAKERTLRMLSLFQSGCSTTSTKEVATDHQFTASWNPENVPDIIQKGIGGTTAMTDKLGEATCDFPLKSHDFGSSLTFRDWNDTKDIRFKGRKIWTLVLLSVILLLGTMAFVGRHQRGVTVTGKDMVPFNTTPNNGSPITDDVNIDQKTEKLHHLSPEFRNGSSSGASYALQAATLSKVLLSPHNKVQTMVTQPQAPFAFARAFPTPQAQHGLPMMHSFPKALQEESTAATFLDKKKEKGLGYLSMATVLYFALPLISGGGWQAILGWMPAGLMMVLATFLRPAIGNWMTKKWRQMQKWKQKH